MDCDSVMSDGSIRQPVTEREHEPGMPDIAQPTDLVATTR